MVKEIVGTSIISALFGAAVVHFSKEENRDKVSVRSMKGRFSAWKVNRAAYPARRPGFKSVL